MAMIESTKQIFKAGAYVMTAGQLAIALKTIWIQELWNLNTPEKEFQGLVFLIFLINVGAFATEKVIKFGYREYQRKNGLPRPKKK